MLLTSAFLLLLLLVVVVVMVAILVLTLVDIFPRVPARNFTSFIQGEHGGCRSELLSRR